MGLSTTFVRMPQPALARWSRFANAPTIGALRTLRRLPVRFGRTPSDPFRIAKERTWRQVSSRELAARIRTVMAEDARDLLRTLEYPLLCLAASEDSVAPAHNLQDIATLKPDVTLAELPGSHTALVHQATRAADIIGRFVVRHSDPCNAAGNAERHAMHEAPPAGSPAAMPPAVDRRAAQS